MNNFLSQNFINFIIGNNIKYYREERNLTQSKLAELCELHDNTIKNIETGKITPNIYTLYKISTVLDESIENLLKND